MSAPSDTRPPWQIVVSAKSLDQAKSRLAVLGDAQRRALAAGMAEDVIAAIIRARSVARVVVVCDDPALIRIARSYGADVRPDPRGGLNAAFRQGMQSAAGGYICLMTTDLPCLTPQMVDSVLAAAAEHERAVVPDLAETGTTLLASTPWSVTSPQFGPGSFRRHVAAGAQPIALDLPQARCDVDTPEDLRLALRLGVGRRTAAAAAALY
jgi:2-phospho-L-lactate guanylyltransferase